MIKETSPPRLRILWLIWSVILLSFLFCSEVTIAQDDGYYLKNADISVEVNDKREYLVTETLDVHFKEKRHGIILTLPHANAAENFTIADVSVTGAPSEISEEVDSQTGVTETVVRIGDPDEKIQGDVQYVVKYKRVCYDDNMEDADYIYFDVFGSGWDTYAKKVRGEIKFPDGAELLDCTVTSGNFGETNNDIATAKVNANKIIIESTETVDTNQAITLNAKFKEGAFANAPAPTYSFTVEDLHSEIEVTAAKEYIVRQKLSLMFNSDADSETAKINLLSGMEKDAVKVSNVILDGKPYDCKNTDSVVLYGKSGKRRDVDLSYKLTPTMREYMKFALIDHSWGAPAKKLSAKIILPFEPTRYDVEFGLPGEEQDKKPADLYKLKQDGNILTFSTDDVKVGQHADISVDMDNSLFARRISPWNIVAIITAMAVVAGVAVSYAKFGRDVKLDDVNTARPPEGLSSAEVGYIINKTANVSDITSLIPYWANDGHIRIDAVSKDEFTLTRLSDLGGEHKEFEKELFLSLFNGKESVNSADVGSTFLNGITKAQEELPKIFTGERSLVNTTSAKIRVLMSFLCGIPLIILGVCMAVDGNRNPAFGLLIGALFYIGGLFGYLIMYEFELNYHKLSYVTRGFLSVLIAVYILIAIAATTFAMGIYGTAAIVNLPIIGAVYLSWLVCIFISKRSEYGNKMLEEILGFKHYILQTKLTDFEREHGNTQEYTYDILPYAQALGLTTEYCNRFKNYAVNPPAWYNYTGTGALHNYALLFLLTRNVSTDIVNKASQNNFQTNSGGTDSSGGGFSGGGFSGGGGGSSGSSW